MKLYAKLQNRDGKIEGLGSGSEINIFLINGNKEKYYLRYTLNTLEILQRGKTIFSVYDDIKDKSKKNWCYHYDYLPYKEEDLIKECEYCIENKKQKGKSQKGEKICSVIGCENKSKYHYQFEDLCEYHKKLS